MEGCAQIFHRAFGDPPQARSSHLHPNTHPRLPHPSPQTSAQPAPSTRGTPALALALTARGPAGAGRDPGSSPQRAPHAVPSPQGDWRCGSPRGGSCSPGNRPGTTRGCPWELLPAGVRMLRTPTTRARQAELEGRDECQQPQPRRDGAEMPPSIADLRDHQETSQRVSPGQCSCSSCSPVSDCPSSPAPGVPSLLSQEEHHRAGQYETLVRPGRRSHVVQVMPRHHDTSSKHGISICRASTGPLLGPVLNPTRRCWGSWQHLPCSASVSLLCNRDQPLRWSKRPKVWVRSGTPCPNLYQK